MFSLYQFSLEESDQRQDKDQTRDKRIIRPETREKSDHRQENHQTRDRRKIRPETRE